MFKNITKSTQPGQDPGYKSVLYIAKTSEVTTWGRPIASPVAPGDKKKISTAHVFAASAGAYKIECKLYSPQGTSSTQGDPGEKTPSHQLVVEIPGDDAALLEFMEDALNEDCVAFIPDADCLTNDSFVQLGDDCKPVDIAWEFDSKKANDNGKKIYRFTVSSPKKFFYLAALTVKA